MIVVTERGIAQSISTLALLARHLDNAEPLMHQIGAMLSNSTVERFHTAKDPDGQPWQPLKPATILRKGHDKILVDSGGLMDSITFTSGRLSARVLATDPNPGKVAAHQFGNPAKNLPQRAIFGLSAKDREDINTLTLLWMEQGT